MTTAYILIQLVTPDPHEVMEAIRAVAGVKQAHLLAGPTDCIAYVEATDQEALAATIIALRGIKGVGSTDTRITVPGV